MQFPSPLIQGTLIKRYKRFLADITLDSGEEVTTHCANSGSMLGLKEEGSKVWVTKIPDESKRKFRYDWHLIQIPGSTERVGINTSWPNHLVEEALKAKSITPLTSYHNYKREVKYGQQNSRIDFLLTEENLPDCYVEIKNVTLKIDNTLQFPDSVTARGTKHLEELIHMKDLGHRAVVLYIAQRTDAPFFKVADHIDPTYAKISILAKEKGVEFYCYTCDINDEEIKIAAPLLIKG